MSRYPLLMVIVLFVTLEGFGQVVGVQSSPLKPVKRVAYTSVKNQASSGTCWSFSTTSLIESQSIKNGLGELDLSEMYTVRSIYTEKAKNYIRRQGKAQFGGGGLGHDVIHAIDVYGAMPESAYSGLTLGETKHNHNVLDKKLSMYLDSLLQKRPIPTDWMKGFESILNDHLGKPPVTFMYKEKQYTPKSFAKEVLRFSAKDYVNITSFTHHPYYEPFILEVPDNFQNGEYYNVPLDEMIKVTERAVETGYSVMWDADVSNKLFRQREGYAMQWADSAKVGQTVSPDDAEIKYDANLRQALYENLTTGDDHLMHIVGLEQSVKGKKLFLVKNSWGEVGPFQGMINVSEAYFALNTVSLVIPRAAIAQGLQGKLGIK
ncbi:MAG: C1 family peptidase [Chryseolinea sp.]